MNSFELNRIVNDLGGYTELIAVLLSIFFLIFLIKLIRIKSPKLVTSLNANDNKTSITTEESTVAIVRTKNKPNWKMKSMAHRSRKPTIYKPKRTIQTQKTFGK